MASKNTVFMTPEESDRVRRQVQEQISKCQTQADKPREPSDPKGLIQQAVSSSLMQDLSFASLGLGSTQKAPETMVAYAVGRTYAPCTTDLQNLESMKLADLRMETHHRGKVLSLRRVSPVVELKASSWAVVQGGTPDEVERLEIFIHKVKHGREVLNAVDEFLVKEPYYTLSMQGEPTIRIDHPSDLVITTYSDGPESWRNTSGAPTTETKTPTGCKEAGNAALEKKNYWQAHVAYTEGLELIAKSEDTTSTLRNDLHRNRSYVNLLLQRLDEAKSDGLASLTGGDDEKQKALDAKGYYRAGTAAYGLGEFEEAKNLFQAQQKLEPDNQLAKLNLTRVEKRLQEKATGTYNMKKISASLTKAGGRADSATFDGPIEIKPSPGAGRGLFATRDIERDAIILCEKAFCLVWSHEPEAFSVLACDVRDDAAITVFPAGLHKAVVQKLFNNPSQVEHVLDLYSDYKGLGNRLLQQDSTPVIDTFQVHDIVQRNAFSPGQQTEEEDVSNASTGLWVKAAYINHSCVANAKRDFVGDLMVVRALRPIAAGEEITHGYDESSDYETRTKVINRTWGFKCRCALCVAEEADGPALRKKRADREREANSFVEKQDPRQAKRTPVFRAKRLLQSLQETYDEERYKDLPRRALLNIQTWLQMAPTY